jgi:hypothetical protein
MNHPICGISLIKTNFPLFFFLLFFGLHLSLFSTSVTIFQCVMFHMLKKCRTNLFSSFFCMWFWDKNPLSWNLNWELWWWIQAQPKRYGWEVIFFFWFQMKKLGSNQFLFFPFFWVLWGFSFQLIQFSWRQHRLGGGYGGRVVYSGKVIPYLCPFDESHLCQLIILICIQKLFPFWSVSSSIFLKTHLGFRFSPKILKLVNRLHKSMLPLLAFCPKRFFLQWPPSKDTFVCMLELLGMIVFNT